MMLCAVGKLGCFTYIPLPLDLQELDTDQVGSFCSHSLGWPSTGDRCTGGFQIILSLHDHAAEGSLGAQTEILIGMCAVQLAALGVAMGNAVPELLAGELSTFLLNVCAAFQYDFILSPFSQPGL